LAKRDRARASCSRRLGNGVEFDALLTRGVGLSPLACVPFAS
jgi:hypothetical protein